MGLRSKDIPDPNTKKLFITVTQLGMVIVVKRCQRGSLCRPSAPRLLTLSLLRLFRENYGLGLELFFNASSFSSSGGENISFLDGAQKKGTEKKESGPKLTKVSSDMQAVVRPSLKRLPAYTKELSRKTKEGYIAAKEM